MAVKAIIDSLDQAPEALRSEYKAGTAEAGTEGKFVLDVEAVGGFNLENVDGLKSALSSERTNLANEKARNKAFEGIDPEAAKSALTKVAEWGTLDPKKDIDRQVQEKLDAQLGQINDRHKADLTKKDTQVSARDALLRQTFQREAAIKALAEAKGDVDLLLPHVLPSIAFDLEEKDENGTLSLVPKTRIVDQNGNTRIGDSQGGNMTIQQFVTEMKSSEKFARLFEGSGHEGSGDRKSPGGGGGSGKKIADMTRKEKAGLIGEIGQAAYNQRASDERAAAAAAS